jgi:hypothetical protein
VRKGKEVDAWADITEMRSYEWLPNRDPISYSACQ